MPVSIEWSNEKRKRHFITTRLTLLPMTALIVTYKSNCHLDPHNPSLFLGFSIVGDVAHVEVEKKLFEFLFDLFFGDKHVPL